MLIILYVFRLHQNFNLYFEKIYKFSHFASTSNNSIIFLILADTLGTEGGSSWASETTSPGSSCATPNSAVTEAPESELSFTVGATDATPHSCRFCEKAFPRQSYLKKHEQVRIIYIFQIFFYLHLPVRFSASFPFFCFISSPTFLRVLRQNIQDLSINVVIIKSCSLIVHLARVIVVITYTEKQQIK